MSEKLKLKGEQHEIFGLLVMKNFCMMIKSTEVRVFTQKFLHQTNTYGDLNLGFLGFPIC